MGDETIIKTLALTKNYNNHPAVDHLSLMVEEGIIFGFLGPNGAGKTTTLLMLLGLTQPSGGSARVCGLDPARRARDVKKLVGYLPENVGFYGDMNAFQSLQYVADLNGMNGKNTDKKIGELLEVVGLLENASKKVDTYSRGMRQRLGIAEVLIKEPKVLFLDEPTLGLDPDGAFRLIELIRSLNRERGITVLLSSHHLQQVQKISHRVGIMIKGRLVAENSIDALAKEKFGIGDKKYSLEDVYMKYFRED
jgi:ABC-2 type transport system ATP-binding protein